MKKIRFSIFTFVALSLSFCLLLNFYFKNNFIGAAEVGTSSENPFLVSSVNDLITLQLEVNSGDSKSGKYYALTSDLDLSDEIWTPIGKDTQNAFKGFFDGREHFITGLYISDPDDSDVGLFGYVFGGAILNLNIEVDIIYGLSRIGGVAGTLNNGSIINCHVDAVAIYGHDRVGGIAGSVNVASTGIVDCSFSGVIEGYGSGSAFDNIGGIAGFFSSSRIYKCFAEGVVKGRDFVGGIVGHASGSAVLTTIEHTYFTGEVTGRNMVGGIIGDMNTPYDNQNVLVNFAYSTGWVLGETNVGGIAGFLCSGTLSNSAALGISTEATKANPGRVLGGKSSGTLLNNIAYDGMLYDDLNADSGKEFPNDPLLNGETIYANDIFTDGTINGLFTSPIWVSENGKLPSFKAAYDLDAYDYLKPTPLAIEMFNAVSPLIYTGSFLQPVVTAISGVSFQIVSYTNNKDAGTASVLVTGTGNYSGNLTIPFTIQKATPNTGVPSNLVASYNDLLSDITLPLGWQWDDPNTLIDVVGSTSFSATYIPEDTINYSNITTELPVLVHQKMVTMPTINTNLIYDGTTKIGVNEPVEVLYQTQTGSVLEAIDENTYSATFKLIDANYLWENGSNLDLVLFWTIASALGEATLSMNSFTYGEQASEPILSNIVGDYSLITYEYSLFSDFSTLSLSAPTASGTYFVRAILQNSSSGNYADLTTEVITYQINKKPVTDFTLPAIADHVYNGFQQTPIVNILNLTYESDYLLSFENNLNAGIAFVIVTGINNYSGLVKIPFNILKAPLMNNMFSALPNFTYSGNEQKPVPNASSSLITFSISKYTNNINAGMASVTITGTENYTGDIELSFVIQKATPNYLLPSALEATFGDTLLNVTLPLNWLFDLDLGTPVGSFGKNIFYATYTDPDTTNYLPVNVPLIVNVLKQKVAIPTINTNLVYDGNLKIGIKDTSVPGITTVSGSTISATLKGTYSATFMLANPNYIWMDGNEGSITLNWTIGSAVGLASVSISDFVYGSEPSTPQIAIESGSWQVIIFEYSSKSDFSEILLAVPESAGTYFIRALLLESENSSYADLTTDIASFSILKLDISTLTANSIDDVVYNGLKHEIIPEISGLTLNVDYTINYENNQEAGTALIVVNGINNYQGTLNINFTITPKTVLVTPLSNQGKAFGEVDPILEYSTDGLLLDDTLIGNLERTPGEVVGTYLITSGTLANKNYIIDITNNVYFNINKSIQATPTIKIIEITTNSVLIEKVTNGEYSIDGINWQNENTFIDLEDETTYTVYLRVKGDYNKATSDVSSLSFHTKEVKNPHLWWLILLLMSFVFTTTWVLYYFFVVRKNENKKHHHHNPSAEHGSNNHQNPNTEHSSSHHQNPSAEHNSNPHKN